MMKRNLKICLVLLLIASLATGQKGGGGGGGRGGGGGGGGGSRGGGGGSRSYYGSGGKSKSCAQTCGDNQDCIEQCNRKSAIIGGVIGGVFGVILLIGGICLTFACCKKQGRCNSCECNCCGRIKNMIKYWKLTKNYSQTDPRSMSQEQFTMKRDGIIKLLNSSKNIRNFAYYQGANPSFIQCTAEVVKQSNFDSEISLFGSDVNGHWTAKGHILCRNGQIFIWFRKQYQDKQLAGQTGLWQYLIYESSTIDSRSNINGNWFYLGHQFSSTYSGTWKLEDEEIKVQTKQIMHQQIAQVPKQTKELQYIKAAPVAAIFSMTVDEFNAKRDYALSLINQSKTKRNFTYNQSQSYVIECTAKITQQQDYKTKIKLTGNDSLGSWKGDGHISYRSGQVYLWFKKQYDNKSKAGQTGRWKDLVYQSNKISLYNKEISGKWYYVGFEYSYEYSGTWKLTDDGTHNIQGSTQEILSYVSDQPQKKQEVSLYSKMGLDLIFKSFKLSNIGKKREEQYHEVNQQNGR